jgi:hypothetical protein
MPPSSIDTAKRPQRAVDGLEAAPANPEYTLPEWMNLAFGQSTLVAGHKTRGVARWLC